MSRLVKADPALRVLALAIDFAVFGVLYLATPIALDLAGAYPHGEARTLSWLPPLFLLLLFAYFAFMNSLVGGTAGKRFLGIVIVGKDGKRIGLLVSTLRTAAFFVLGALFGLDYIYYFINRDRRCLHDVIAGTNVMREVRR
jgi:uncharacterized RDD family membrane protein YckC